MRNFFLYLFAFYVLSGCSVQKQAALHLGIQLHFIGQTSIPYKMQFKGTTVGGLSGIDYDADRDVYYIICDDGSKINAARFYTAKIMLRDAGIDSFYFVGVTPLLQPDARVYPATGVDPEAMRYNPRQNVLYWSSEGERTIQNQGVNLINPFVHVADVNGKFRDSFALPLNMYMHVQEKGPRNNGSFEGLAFDNSYKTLYVSVEEPLFEDGPRAGSKDSTALVRILKFDVASKKQLAQYAYRLDAVSHAAVPATAFKINGISDILWIAKNKLLVIERSFSTGHVSNVIKLYLADVSDATDVSSVNSVYQNASVKPASKTLLLNMDSLGIVIDNIEGVTFGPVLPNGHRSLIFISDDNFSSTQKTQLLLFEIK